MDNLKELKPIYDHTKSFYKKAYILRDNAAQTIKLYSYNTYICTLDYGGYIIAFNQGAGYYGFTSFLTVTTLRHLKEFLKQYGAREYFNISKKDILKINESIKNN